MTTTATTTTSASSTSLWCANWLMYCEHSVVVLLLYRCVHVVIRERMCVYCFIMSYWLFNKLSSIIEWSTFAGSYSQCACVVNCVVPSECVCMWEMCWTRSIQYAPLLSWGFSGLLAAYWQIDLHCVHSAQVHWMCYLMQLHANMFDARFLYIYCGSFVGISSTWTDCRVFRNQLWTVKSIVDRKSN